MARKQRPNRGVFSWNTLRSRLERGQRGGLFQDLRYRCSKTVSTYLFHSVVVISR